MLKIKKTNAKKIAITFIIIIAIVSFSIILYADNNVITNPITITFEDEKLYVAMVRQLGAKKIKINGNNESHEIEISQDDVTNITELNLQGSDDSKITNLSGLENFNQLEELNLSNNAVAKMDSISNLTNIQKLNMSGNVVNTNMLENIKKLTSLTELDMSNTQMNGDQLDYFKTLVDLQKLTLANNNISKLDGIKNLKNITKLDISSNTSFTSFGQLVATTTLTELNVSNTGISNFTGISELVELEKLYAANITPLTSIADIYATYDVKEGTMTVKKPYLKDLRVLNLNSMGTTGKRPSISFSNLSILSTLEELHLASNDISNLSNVAKLENLDYIDLSNNKIQTAQLDNFLQYKTVNGVKILMTENTLKASKIDLNRNEIIDISMFATYPGDIKWLDLSGNHIYDISPISKYNFSSKNDNGKTLYLQNQDITFGVYKKTAQVDQYIILPTILKNSMIKGSCIYDENANFQYTGVTLNPKYTNPEQYNVIISYTKTKDDELSVKLTGGNADGTILRFAIGKNGHPGCQIESLLFEDENLDAAIYNDLTTKYGKSITYLERVPRIININQAVISKVTEFNLQHTSSDANTKIQNLAGLENFYNLVTLYLQDNNVNSIDPLATCTKLQNLLLANNPNLGNNNSSIQNMKVLTNLDLSNTGMTNIDSINNLTQYLKQKTKLVILNISDNGLNNIDGIEQITTLQKLYIANEKLNDEKIAKIANLTSLSTLNINGNQINDISIISNLSELKYLYFNNNQVKSIEPIRGKTFYELEFSGNRVKDISALSSHRTINNLKANNNNIEDATVLNNIEISQDQILSLTGQKIVRTLEKDSTGEVTIELPQIFKAAHENGNKLFTNSEYMLTNCKLDSTGNSIIINVDELNGQVAQVEIYGGKANGTVLTIAPPLEGNINYTPTNLVKTNSDVVATVTFNREDVTITNNNGNNTYTFTQNGEFTFEFTDKYGFDGTVTAKVQNIDKEAPVGQVTQVKKGDKVEVTITTNEKVLDVDGWTSIENEDGTMKLIKTYSEDADETVKLVDEAGNSSTVNIKVNMTVVDDTIKSSTLDVSESELNIKGINPKTLTSDFKKNITSEMEYEVLNKKGEKLSDTDKIGTGCQIKMQSGKVYTIIVWGDLDGDGQISLTELARISKIEVNKVTPTDLELSAIDMNTNGKLDLTELAAIAKLQVK